MFRKLNPDTWRWADPGPQLLAEIATMLSDLRFFQAARLFGIDDLPAVYLPGRFGPPGSEPAADAANTAPARPGKRSDADIIADANALRAELGRPAA